MRRSGEGKRARDREDENDGEREEEKEKDKQRVRNKGVERRDCWIRTQDCSFTIWCRYL
jgi:hypothetical protein